ncbi:trehalose-phosphatase [Glycocaulis sp.]|uniref:trehalose-phosphatase n=1 Tax=Glycocaulis sp. TaxID=1969725 RepID=UPI003F6FB03A
MTHPPQLNLEADALFLDFDGTLTEIVTRPDDARLSPERANRLSELAARMQGALAILSGRPVSDLDVRLPRVLWRVGGHGAETAAPGELAATNSTTTAKALALTEVLRGVAASLDGVQVEEKPTGAALHFRTRPEAGPACSEAMRAAAGKVGGFEIQHGKMVVEARPAGVNKGEALARLMGMPAFRGRRPVMIGDDLTDESAMHFAQTLGGLAIKVGAGHSCAGFRLHSPEDVHHWLGDALAPALR